MSTLDSPKAKIDFDALRLIDQAIDTALEQNKWTKESFISLYERAITAVALHKETLSFLKEVGTTGWLDGDTECLGLRRLSRPVRQTIDLLLAGWEPFVSLPKGQSLRWNDHDLDIDEVEVLLYPDSARVIARLGSEEREEFRSMVPRPGLVRDTIQANLAHGWQFTSPVAARDRRIVTNSATGKQTIYEFRANNVHITRTPKLPSLWIIPLGSKFTLPTNTNVYRSTWVFVEDEPASNSFSQLGLQFFGTYSYTLIRRQTEEDVKDNFLIVETSENQFDINSLNHDLLAMQFSLGQPMSPGLAYGIEGTNVVALQQVAQWSKSPSEQVQTVPDFWGNRAYVVDFFERVSQALRGPHGRILSAVLRIYLRSFDSLLDISIRELLTGLTILTYKPDPQEALEKHLGEKARAQLAEQGVNLPIETQAIIDELVQKLAIQGAITIGVKNELINKYILFRQELRSVLLAMIAAVVGYTGPIAGDTLSNKPPSWWPQTESSELIANWSASNPPRDGYFEVTSRQLLVLVERPEHQYVVQWLVRSAGISLETLNISLTGGRAGLRKAVKHAKGLEERLIVIADSQHTHIPTAIDSLRREFDLLNSNVNCCPSIRCIEAWLLADDYLVRAQNPDETTLQVALELPPEEQSDARTLAYRIFGPPEFWDKIENPDIYRSAERSPSLRRFLQIAYGKLDIKSNLPVQSISRTISRNAIAGLIRDLLAADTVAWRTSDDQGFTAEELAREVEQGTETGRQYTLDLISMMINTLSRRARLKG